MVCVCFSLEHQTLSGYCRTPGSIHTSSIPGSRFGPSTTIGRTVSLASHKPTKVTGNEVNRERWAFLGASTHLPSPSPSSRNECPPYVTELRTTRIAADIFVESKGPFPGAGRKKRGLELAVAREALGSLRLHSSFGCHLKRASYDPRHGISPIKTTPSSQRPRVR